MVEEEVFNNFFIKQAYFRNTGDVPILPSDYHENLSVSVIAPWRIVAVESRREYHEVVLHWERISNIRFEAEPALINAGDTFGVNVYLTNTEFSDSAGTSGDANDDPDIEWNARITNL